MAETIKKTIKDGGPEYQGRVTFTSFEIDSPEAEKINNELATAVLIDPARYNFLTNELRRLCRSKILVKDNLCVQAGRVVAAMRLGGDTTYTGIINYGALGTGSAAVSDADTTLGTEVKRKPVATVTRVNDQVTFDFFYSKSDTNGTYNEFGMFIDGTATVDTGQLFNRLLTGGWTKSSSVALTVSVQVNINHA